MFLKNRDSAVEIGDTVLVVINGEAKELEIVDMPSGEPGRGIISWLSPLAQALLGKKYPSKVTVKLPDGKHLDCELVKIMH